MSVGAHTCARARTRSRTRHARPAGSLIWLQRTLLVAELVEAPNDRTSLFAKVSSASAVIIAVLQLLATGARARRA